MTKQRRKSYSRVKKTPFYQLDKNKQTFIKLDFEGSHSNKEIAVACEVKREGTISDWRNSSWYQSAHDDYVSHLVKGSFKNKALNTLVKLLNAKSEMVRLQASTMILKLSGMFTESDTPAMVRAKEDKLIAEAKMAQLQVKTMQGTDDNGNATVVVDDIKEAMKREHSSDKQRD